MAHLFRRKVKMTGSPFLNVLGFVPAIYVLTKSILYRDTSCLCMDKCHGLGNKEKTFTKASRIYLNAVRKCLILHKTGLVA